MKRIDFELSSVDGARVTGYVHEDYENEFSGPRPCVVVCPGGGYRYLTPEEGEPVAMAFCSRGYNAFVCYYPICEHAVYPAPQLAVFETVKYIRDNHAGLYVKPDNIAVAGFSAGGHVAACAGVLYGDAGILKKLDAEPSSIRPDAMILVFPCIGVDIDGYDGGIAKKNVLRCDEHVTRDTPPAYIVTSFGDKFVCCNQSLNMARALSDNNVPFELHCFEPGDHGYLNNNNTEPDSCTTRRIGFDSWFNMCIDWLGDRWSASTGFGKSVSAEGRIIEDYFRIELMG